MPRKGTYHDIVKDALERDGWTITHDPLTLSFGAENLYIDLGAQTPIGAEKGDQKIAVEIKSFLHPSKTADLEQELGQFRLYRFLLQREEPERQLTWRCPRKPLRRYSRMLTP